MENHVFYTRKDKNIPSGITDRNGDIVLQLCKICGGAEAGLSRYCLPEIKEGDIIIADLRGRIIEKINYCPVAKLDLYWFRVDGELKYNVREFITPAVSVIVCFPLWATTFKSWGAYTDPNELTGYKWYPKNKCVLNPPKNRGDKFAEILVPIHLYKKNYEAKI